MDCRVGTYCLVSNYLHRGRIVLVDTFLWLATPSGNEGLNTLTLVVLALKVFHT